jgi:hypothetical protein
MPEASIIDEAIDDFFHGNFGYIMGAPPLGDNCDGIKQEA